MSPLGERGGETGSGALWYRRWPRCTAFCLGLLVVLCLDLLFGALLLPGSVGSLRRPDAYLHHDLVPNRHVQARWGPSVYTVATNSLGLRDGRVRRLPLASELHRILLLGDSFVEGIGVDWPATFVGQLEERLEGSGVELLNAGVVGYSPKLYLRKAERLIEQQGLEVDEIFVFVDNSDIPNEIVYQSWGAEERFPVREWRRLARFARRHSYLLDKLGPSPSASRDLRWNAAGMPFSDDLDGAVFEDPGFLAGGRWTEQYAYAARGFALADQSMEGLVTFCRRHDLDLTIVVYPWPKNVELHDLEHVQVRHWRRFAAERRVRFVDLYPDFIAWAERPGHTYQDLFIRGDVHWSARGHALVAARLLPLARARMR